MKALRNSPGGFSLAELLVALVIFQVGLLAVAGMVFLAQQNLARAELRTRAYLEAKWVADSMGLETAGGSGRLGRPWGEVRWAPFSEGPGGTRVVALGPGGEDTLASLVVWAPPPDTILWGPDGFGGEETSW